jgi:NarL family two-component system response regulator LiaR
MAELAVSGQESKAFLRVLLVDHQPVVRAGLMPLLWPFGDLEVIGTAENEEEGLALHTATLPDVILLDPEVPDLNIAAFVRTVRRIRPPTMVLAFTNAQDPRLVRQAFQAGTIGYVLKSISAEALAAAIRAAHQGRPTVAPEVMSALVDVAAGIDLYDYGLTEREIEILALIARGWSNAVIAQNLDISPLTVKFHVSNILSKLGVTSRGQAASLAWRQGLI